MRAYVEWHRETAENKNGKLGLHVVEFNEEGLLHRVIVFAHA